MSESKTVKRYPLLTFFARILLYLFTLLPLWLSHGLGYLLGLIGNRFHNELRYVASINIRHCLPQLTARQQRRLVRQFLIGTGKTFTEVSAMLLWPRGRILHSLKQVSGEGLVEQARAGGKGVIFAIPHMGAWEMVGVYCSSRYPMTSLYRPPRMQAMDPVIRRGRERFGARLVPTDNRGVRALLQALKQGETVAILPDQVPAEGQGLYAPFFGTPAYSMTLLSRLAQKTGAVVIFTYVERLSWGRGYHLHFRPAEEAVYSHDMEVSVSAVNRGIEQCILECPAQYQWGYRRYRNPIPRTPDIYS